jgi:hypothetical protein
MYLFIVFLQLYGVDLGMVIIGVAVLEVKQVINP